VIGLLLLGNHLSSIDWIPHSQKFIVWLLYVGSLAAPRLMSACIATLRVSKLD